MMEEKVVGKMKNRLYLFGNNPSQNGAEATALKEMGFSEI